MGRWPLKLRENRAMLWSPLIEPWALGRVGMGGKDPGSRTTREEPWKRAASAKQWKVGNRAHQGARLGHAHHETECREGHSTQPDQRMPDILAGEEQQVHAENRARGQRPELANLNVYGRNWTCQACPQRTPSPTRTPRAPVGVHVSTSVANCCRALAVIPARSPTRPNHQAA
jgi:hypothetical protein